jgi:hypothetical protein
MFSLKRWTKRQMVISALEEAFAEAVEPTRRQPMRKHRDTMKIATYVMLVLGLIVWTINLM